MARISEGVMYSIHAEKEAERRAALRAYLEDKR
jgi:hypothetical protein